MENREIMGLYNFILSGRYNKMEINSLVERLQRFVATNNKETTTDNIGIEELAMRVEVEDYLSSQEDERLVNMEIQEFDELVNNIANKLTYESDYAWEHFNTIINDKYNRYLNKKGA